MNVYSPNAQRDLARLPFRLEWEEDMRAYLKKLDQVKPVILCGDLNVAHEEIDIRNVKSNIGNSGFTDEERGKMTALLAEGFIDTFRYFHPDQEDAYTWWSYMSKVRERNIGWRIDYFIASKRLAANIERCRNSCRRYLVVIIVQLFWSLISNKCKLVLGFVDVRVNSVYY